MKRKGLRGMLLAVSAAALAGLGLAAAGGGGQGDRHLSSHPSWSPAPSLARHGAAENAGLDGDRGRRAVVPARPVADPPPRSHLPAAGPGAGALAPDVAFLTAEGGRVALADYRGRVVLLNFWATWCGPCLEEMPSLDRLQAALGGPDFVVLTVSQDRDGAAAVVPWYRRMGVEHLPVLIDERATAARAFGLTGLPTTLLIDRDGRILNRVLGGKEWDRPATMAMIERAIADGAAPPSAPPPAPRPLEETRVPAGRPGAG